MSKRLQITLDDREINEIRTIARLRQMTFSEWVRATLRAAVAEQSSADPRRKLQALRTATSYSFPTADIEEMLAQIGRDCSNEPE